jgi:hypothetical protein
LPFLPIVPAVIVIVGVAAAAAITRFGVDQLRDESDRATAVQSRILTLTLGERLKATPHAGLTPDVLSRVGRSGLGKRMREHPDPEFNQVITRAAIAPERSFCSWTNDGGIVVDETDGAPQTQTIKALEKHGQRRHADAARRELTSMPCGSSRGSLAVADRLHDAAETPSRRRRSCVRSPHSHSSWWVLRRWSVTTWRAPSMPT